MASRDLNADYALDTEFTSGRWYSTELSLVQIGWPDRIALIDPYLVDLTLLAPLFQGGGQALFHAAQGDLELLEIAVGVRPSRLFDTQVAGQLLGYSTPSLAYMVQKYVGVSLDKTHQRTDWTVRPLSESVRHYAASDVAHLHELVAKVTADIEALNRLAWLESENEVVRTQLFTTTPPEELWWRLSRATGIPSGRQLGAQRLAIMRNDRAQRRNKPLSHIITDDAMVSLASKPPATLRDFKNHKGCANIPEPFAMEIIDLLTRAKDESPGELRRLPGGALDPDLEPLVNVLAAVAAQRAIDLTIDFKILATRKDITDFVAQQPSRVDVAWRQAVLGDDLHALLRGEASIQVRDQRVVIERDAPL